MKKLAIVFVVFALLGFASTALAQTTLKNPTGATFTASVDHATIDSYEIGWFLPTATDPVSTTSLGKPTPDGTNTCSVTINVMPLAFNTYVAKVRAIAGTASSDWSGPSNLFQRAPGTPGGPVVK